jgi:hypothetical protein
VSWIPIVSGLANLMSFLMIAILSFTFSIVIIAVGWIRYGYRRGSIIFHFLFEISHVLSDTGR